MLILFAWYLLIGILVGLPAVYAWRKINAPDLRGSTLFLGLAEVYAIWIVLWPVCFAMLIWHYRADITEKIRGYF